MHFAENPFLCLALSLCSASRHGATADKVPPTTTALRQAVCVKGERVRRAKKRCFSHKSQSHAICVRLYTYDMYVDTADKAGPSSDRATTKTLNKYGSVA